MTRRKPPVWAIVVAVAVAGAAIGAGAVYAVQQARLADAEERVAALKEVATRTAAEKDAALEKLAEEERASSEETVPPVVEPLEPEPADSPATPLPSSQFAFVKRLKFGKPGTITLDYAEYLTGKKAADAAAAHGDESPPPNDYYIVNDDTKLRELKIAADAKVRLASSPDGTSDPAGYTASVEQWAGYFAAPSDENASIRAAGYWVVIDGGTVTEVREQFIP